MLSGVASDQETLELTKQLTSSELVRMINLIQTTLSGFTRSASRRMDAELCILELCQPELSLDAKALNARLTRLEEQIRSGSFMPATSVLKAKRQAAEDDYDDDRPPMPDDADAPPEEGEPAPVVQPSEAPVGFWSELCGNVRKELRPPVSGFFVASPNAPVQGFLTGNTLELRCSNDFTAKMLDKPELLEVVSRKASAMLNRPVRAVVVDINAKPAGNPRMEQLMNFGRAHSDIVRIKNN
jgi:DNA polymerase-3 subunit gamma/tau